MRVLFMGTPSLAARVLEHLIDPCEVCAVFTRADAVRGRGKALVASPVKEVAKSAGIDVYTPERLSDVATVDIIRSLDPDVICVAAYGMILPRSVLDIPKYGCLNVHSSLLPRWRGAAPIERAILEGDEVTGVSIMRMEEGLDTGPYCLREKVQIKKRNLDELASLLADEGGRLLMDSLHLVESGSVRWIAQESIGVTYARKIEKGELDPTLQDDALTIDRKVRASSPAHPSKVVIAGKPLTLEAVQCIDAVSANEIGVGKLAGGEAAFKMRRLFLGTTDQPIEVLKVKPDGKKSMDARSFAAGIQGIKKMSATWGTR